MRLPEIAVEQPYKGGRNFWTRSERWNFYFALGILFLVPVAVDSAVSYVWVRTGDVISFFVLWPFTFVLAIVFWISSITLLSVAYRRNLLKHKGELQVSINMPQ
jgi:hypothetical protein